MGRERSLLRALTITIPELIRFDLLVGLAGGAGGIWLALESPQTVERTSMIASQLIGVIVGAVIAGVAVIAAFMDQPFLRKLKLIERRPQHYLEPFVVTAVLGVWAFLFLIALGAIPDSAPTWLRGGVAGVAGLFTTWSIMSLLPCLKLLLDFVGLKDDAAGVSDSMITDDELEHRRSAR